MPDWILLAVLSAVLLGIYDAAKKDAVSRRIQVRSFSVESQSADISEPMVPGTPEELSSGSAVNEISSNFDRESAKNPVPLVLFFANVVGGLFWIAVLGIDTEQKWVAPITLHWHALIFGKSALVASSWTFAYYGLQRLPLSIAAPLRATGPIWTIVLAVCLMGERPNGIQSIGVLVVLSAFFLLSMVGKTEGIRFHRDRGIVWMILGTLLGSLSGIYDKYLLQTVAVPFVTLQTWFAIYLIPSTMPMAVWWWVGKKRERFRWRHSILAIPLFLMAADLAYFAALARPDALVSVISPVRRMAVLISLGFGIWCFGEKNAAKKSFCVAILCLGILIAAYGSR